MSKENLPIIIASKLGEQHSVELQIDKAVQQTDIRKRMQRYRENGKCHCPFHTSQTPHVRMYKTPEGITFSLKDTPVDAALSPAVKYNRGSEGDQPTLEPSAESLKLIKE